MALPPPSPSLPVHPLLRVLDAQLSADDRLELNMFLRGPVGSKVVKSLLVATPATPCPVPQQGAENETLFRSGLTKGWTLAVEHLVRLGEREEPVNERMGEAFPNLDDEEAWDGDTPRKA